MILLDASAVLAVLFDEPGAEIVTDAFGSDPALTTGNLAEVLERVVREGRAPTAVLAELRGLVTFVAPTEDDALGAAALYPHTRRPALSLADRLALATAGRLGVPVLTAERAWLDVPSGAEVRPIR